MVKQKPPLGPERPVLDHSCGRLMADPNKHHCGEPATKHVMWDGETTDNGLCCDFHFEEAKARWNIFDFHPIGAVCTMPDCVWIDSWTEPPGCCRWIISDETMALEEAADRERELVNGG